MAWGKPAEPEVVTAMAKLDAGFSALISLQLGLIAAYLKQAKKEEIIAKVDAWRKASAPFAKKHGIKWQPYQVAIDTLKKGIDTAKKLDAYGEALHDLHIDVAEAESIVDDNTISRDQVNIAVTIIRLLKTGNVDTQLPKLVQQIGILGDPDLNKWYKPKVEDQGKFEEELRFLVKKLAGRDDHVMTPEEIAAAKEKDPKRHKRYTDVRKQAFAVYKNALRDAVRSSGNKTITIEDAEKAMKVAKINVNGLPKNFKGKIDENGRLYTTADKEIEQLPSPGSEIVMNKDYNPKTDDSNVFIYKPPFATDFQYAYTKDNLHKKKKVVFEKVTDLGSRIKSARRKWIEQLNSDDPDEAAMGAMVELLYTHGMRIGGAGNQTDGKATYGLTTLLVKQVRPLASGKLKIAYEGKSGMDQQHIVSPNNIINKRVIAVVEALVKGKKPAQKVFVTKHGTVLNAIKVNAYLKTLGLKTTAHKFRHLLGTMTLNKVMAAKPLKANATQGEAEAYYRKCAKEVGRILGHQTAKGGVTENTALKNYLNPMAGIKFFQNRGLHTPKFLKYADR